MNSMDLTNDQINKMLDSKVTLTKSGLSGIDKILNVSFMRKNLSWSTKRDFTLFAQNYGPLEQYLKTIEDKLKVSNEKYRKLIVSYVNNISEEASNFKKKLSSIHKQRKLDKKNDQKTTDQKGIKVNVNCNDEGFFEKLDMILDGKIKIYRGDKLMKIIAVSQSDNDEIIIHLE